MTLAVLATTGARAAEPSVKIDAPVRETALAVLTHLVTAAPAADPVHPHAHHSKLVLVNAAGELLVHVLVTGSDPERVRRRGPRLRRADPRLRLPAPAR